MMENLVLVEQVLCLSLVDCALAALGGLLLAGFWIARSNTSTGNAASASIIRPFLSWTALILALVLCAQFWLLTMAMAGQSAPGAILQSMPEVASTHAGHVTVGMLSLSVLLAAACLFRIQGAASSVQSILCTVLFGAIVFFHAALGHAAGDGDFTRAELLQFLHVAAMTLWAGGIFVSALVALPRLAETTASTYAAYLRGLSNTSAWSASTAILTGALKSWIAINAKLGNLAQPGWGRILWAKLFFVCIALGLGFLHRRKVHDSECQWSILERKTLVRTLRVEAVCLAWVIVLSAWLSSVDPPE